MEDWKCVEDEIPEESGTYICLFSDGVIESFPFEENDDQVFWGVDSAKVTHWMPLPEPPALEVSDE